ncbi:MAG: DUF853 family protein [Lysobacteraceae bacterium]|nr:MAG: DUF853 family protein [Xanthomonadaceae bacterium]
MADVVRFMQGLVVWMIARGLRRDPPVPNGNRVGSALAAEDAADDADAGGFGSAVKDAVFGTKRRQGMIETMAKQTARTVGSQVGRQILRGILGGIFGGKR